MSIGDEQRASMRTVASNDLKWGNGVEKMAARRILALLAEVDTLREQSEERRQDAAHWEHEYDLINEALEKAETNLRDMEIERNMLRICVKELTDSLEAGDACGAVGCRAMKRLSEVIDEAADDLLVRATRAEERLAKVEALATRENIAKIRKIGARGQKRHPVTKEMFEALADALAALSTERGA